MELDYDNGTVAYMASKGHNVSRIEWRQSDVHAIRLLSDNVFEAAAETSLVNSGGYVI
jgi:gamma-glutamyltranspeptidase/glutathione hydrolase